MARLKLFRLVKSLAYDVGLKLSDVEYLTRRLKSEGLRFLTKTLPGLEAAVLRSLEIGVFERPTSFAWQRGSLRYFQVLLNRIFCPETGRVLHSSETAPALKKLRQLCSYLYKLAVEFDDDQETEAASKYLSLEWGNLAAEVFDKNFVHQMRKHLHTYFKEFTDATLSDIFSHVQHVRFGPGSFFGSDRRHESFAVQKLLPESIIGTTEDSFSAYSGYFRAALSKRGGRLPICLKPAERTCEVLFVPKDSRGPRVISKEPLHLLRGQLAYFDWATELLMRKTQRSIEFLEQRKNQELALHASITGEFVTADLSSASDRVRYDVCSELFRYTRGVRELIVRYRSTRAIVKSPGLNHVVEPLRKLSGMGSGLTFPTMALVIFLATFTEVHKRYRVTFNNFIKKFSVYGDDVIIHRDWYECFCSAMKRVCLVINHEKTYVQSHFRESCGGDYYNGEDVTPIRMRLSNAKLKTSREIGTCIHVDNDAGLLQLERHARHLVCAGMHRTSEQIYAALEEDLGELPTVFGDSPYLGRYENQPIYYQKPFKYAYVPRAVHLTSRKICQVKRLAGWLLENKNRSFTGLEGIKHLLEDLPSIDSHAVALPRKLYLKRVRVGDPMVLGQYAVNESTYSAVGAELSTMQRHGMKSPIGALESVVASFYAIMAYAIDGHMS